MNKKAQELNLKHTHFITPHGLDEEGHYTTGYELALIADYALNIEKIAKKCYNINSFYRRYKIMSKKHEAGRIFVKIMAAVLAILMIVAMAGTLIYYMVH